MARELGRLRVVRDHDDGLAVVAVQLPEQREDVDRRLAVEVAGRLIANEQGRIGDEGARDRDALLLSAGELARLVLGAVLESDELEGDAGVAAPLGGRELGEQQRQLDVAPRGEHRQQVVELKHEADMARAPLGERTLAE